ncbi:11769_t:CDS:2, partial [Ambispora gerdemannii]
IQVQSICQKLQCKFYSKFTNEQIQTIRDHFTKKPNIEFTDDQDNSSDDLPETEPPTQKSRPERETRTGYQNGTGAVSLFVFKI